MKKYIFLGLIITLLIMPVIVSAGDLSGPLVPCGTSTTSPCTFCHLFVLAQTIIDFITTGIFILAGLFIVIGGMTILFAGAVPSNLELGKKMITNAVIGVVIALLAWTVINMIFNTLVSTDKTKFPAPWNDIKCQGGGLVEGGSTCCCDVLRELKLENYCRPQNYSSPTECVSSCTSFCKGYAGDGYQGSCCVNGKLGSGQTCGQYQSTYCCCNLTDGTYSCKPDPYISFDSCNANTGGCSSYCKAFAADKYSSHCCVATKGKCGTTDQWCQRSAPGGSGNWKLGNINPKQKGDASSGLVSFINCMYGKLPGLKITSISDDKLCSGSCVPTTGAGCSHEKNSCHYGGSKCIGSSYAVDFSKDTECSEIKSATDQCDTNTWFHWEGDHAHVSLGKKNNCGCDNSSVDDNCP